MKMHKLSWFSFLRVAGVLVGLSGHSALAQTTWSPVYGLGPLARSRHAMASARGPARAYMHGGLTAIPTALVSDLWEWTAGSWTLVQGPGSALPRWAHAIAYDAARQQLVTFGGYSTVGIVNPPVAETWVWGGQAWQQIAVAGPIGRAMHAMVYDSRRQRCVMYGGVSGSTYLGDTWEWDGVVWSPRIGLVAPAPRVNHAMVYDETRARVVVFGGASAVAVLGDTWEFDGVAWSQVASSGPSARQGSYASYDREWCRTVLHGGYAPLSGVLSDTWIWSGQSWSHVSVAQSPPARAGGAMVYDEGAGVSVLFSGDLSGTYGDTWTLDGAEASAAQFALGCGSPALQLSAPAVQLPVVGASAGLLAANTPQGFAFLAIGASRSFYSGFPLPLTLAGLGMPGCELLQSADIESALWMPQSSNGVAYLQIAIPNVPAFVGVHLYLQAWTGAPGVNAAGFIVSNGLDWKIGNT